MKLRLFYRTLGLFAVLISSACAPAVTATNPAQTPTPTSSPVPTQTIELVPEIPVATEAPTSTVQPMATSRGPELEATDPATVALASGGLQLVEFFRFT